jgi:hypothetical protein
MTLKQIITLHENKKIELVEVLGDEKICTFTNEKELSLFLNKNGYFHFAKEKLLKGEYKQSSNKNNIYTIAFISPLTQQIWRYNLKVLD